MRQLFGDLLPEDVLTRRTKSHFDDAFWSTYSRELAENWDGKGVDTNLVDPEALRQEWSKPRPQAVTFILLQSLALAAEAASAPRELAEAVGGLA
jgi:asparagine synthase (glutamine-hydrolysing)